MSRMVPLLLGVLLIAQLTVIALERPWEVSQKAAPARVRAVPPDPGHQAPRLEPDLAPLEALEDTRTRPLFAANRRPATEEETAAEEVAQAPAAAREKARITLSGIVVANGERRALVRIPPDPKVVHLREGDSLDGWSLSRINTESVEITNGTGETEIKLRQFDPPPPNPAGTPEASGRAQSRNKQREPRVRDPRKR